MWLVLPTAFFIAAAMLSVKFKEKINDTIAITGAAQILVLYLLAVLGSLKLIYVISAMVIVCFIVMSAMGCYTGEGFRTGKIIHIRRKRKVFRRCFDAFMQPSVIVFIVFLIAVTWLTKDQIFTWWDDINFWSSDAKQIYYLGGFSGKYGNVSPEFGDYPPVTSLFKWIFLQISPDRYIEGLQFAGYYALNAVFLMPLTGYVKNKLSPVAVLLVLLIPGIINGIIFYGTPADITMGIIYGALLLAIWDNKGHSKTYYYMRIALYTAVLLLTKNVGIEWAIFALVFWIITRREKSMGIVYSVLFAALFYGSWLGFCLINRRVAKATGLGIKMATGSYAVPANALEKAKFFFLGMWTMPMHADHNITFDLAVGVILLLIAAAFFVMAGKGIIDGSDKKQLGLFLLITAVISYGMIFVAHISLFQAEDQYLDTFAMTNSIARYGAPFTMGGIYLLMGIALSYAGRISRREEKAGTAVSSYAGLSREGICIYAVIAAFILLTTDYAGAYNALFGYREKLDDNMNYNAEMIDDGGRRFLENIYGHRELWGHRVLNLRSGEYNHRVHDTYISKEASPVPVVYDTLTEDDTVSTLEEKIRLSHAEYIFAEETGSNVENLTDAFNSLMTDGSLFGFYSVYRVDESEGGLSLRPVCLY